MTRGYLKENKKGQMKLKCGYCDTRYNIKKEHPDYEEFINRLRMYHNLKYFGYVCPDCRLTADKIVFDILMEKGTI